MFPLNNTGENKHRLGGKNTQTVLKRLFLFGWSVSFFPLFRSYFVRRRQFVDGELVMIMMIDTVPVLTMAPTSGDAGFLLRTTNYPQRQLTVQRACYQYTLAIYPCSLIISLLLYLYAYTQHLSFEIFLANIVCWIIVERVYL